MKKRMLKLSLGLIAGLMCAAASTTAPAPASASCLAVCTTGYCCCGKIPAIDWCTKKTICVSGCIG